MIPAFIGGSGRCGTTLLGAILGAHTRCLVTPESHFKFDLCRDCQREYLKQPIPPAADQSE